jgi:phage terminase large subunit-like protein
VDIVVPHAWFPRPQAQQKADEDNIPLFGWEDDGDLTLCNAPTVQAADVVKWYKERRSQGFKIAEVGHDRKFAKEYWLLMKQAKFNVLDQPQYYYMLSDGFRHIEAKIKNREFYYLHSPAFEYCIANVRGIEKSNQMILYEKYAQEMRIDIFDAAVMACVRHQEALAKNQTKGWW